MIFDDRENLLSHYGETGIADFLTKNRAEAIAVSIFEYDEEKHLRNEREEGIRLGIEQGIVNHAFFCV